MNLTKWTAIAATLALLSACGGTSSLSSRGIQVPTTMGIVTDAGPGSAFEDDKGFSAIDDTNPIPVAVLPDIPVLMTGQSNMAWGTETHGIHSEFGRRAKFYNPNKTVQVTKVAFAGHSVNSWLEGGVAATQLDAAYAKHNLAPARVLGIHQGEADRLMPGDVWVNRWGAAIQRMRNKGQLAPDAIIIFGELAQGGPADQMNNHINNMQRYGARIAQSEGLNTIDGTHFTPASWNLMGRRYYNLIRDNGGIQ